MQLTWQMTVHVKSYVTIRLADDHPGKVRRHNYITVCPKAHVTNNLANDYSGKIIHDFP